jgi:hypothetical protein
MAEQSEITSSDLAAVTQGATACDHLAELSATRTKFATFLDWIVSDPDGNLSTDFKTALIRQMLFDAAKKGWFVASDASTGYLELVETIPLASLDPTGAVEGDTIAFDATAGAWEIRNAPQSYLAPTSGGSTIPAISSGGILSVAHGLGTTPRTFECILECNSTDVGYDAGDRVRADNLIILRDTAGEQMNAVTVGASATLVFVVFQVRSGAGGEYRLINKSTFARDAIDVSKWDVKLSASL